MSEQKEEIQTAAEKPKVKEFFNRKYSNGEKEAVFHLRKARPFELRLAGQKFNDIDNSLSDAEKEDAESVILLEVLKGFSKTANARSELDKTFAHSTDDDIWLLRDCWLDYQTSHNSTVSFL